MRSILVCALILLASSPSWAQEATPFLPGEQGGIIVGVTLNGKGPFKMLLDTGATHSAITADVADLVGARVVAQSNVISAAGSALRPIAAIDSLSVGPVTVDVILPSVAAPAAFDVEGRIKGLIGQDVLAGLRYTLDFEREVIVWHDAAPVERGTVLHLTFERGRFLVALPQGSTVLRLVPDSGSGGLVLFDTSRLTTVATGETVELSTGVATRPARVVRVPALRIGDRTMRNLYGVSVGRGEVQPGVGDGLLPLHLFRRVTFDGPNRLLILG